MDSHEVRRWRDADRLFGQWLDLPADARRSWLAELQVDADVLVLVRRMVERHLSDADDVLGLPALTAAAGAGEAVPNQLAGRRIGDWLLLQELGRGGMSVVYRARRSVAGSEQEAAVKLLGLAAIGSQGRRRFDQERHILARLRHPQIAALIDGGVAEDGTPFLAMTLVEGETLAEHCRRHVPGWPGRVALVRRVCDAVAHAHRNLLVHRDLKPSNVIVTAEGVPVLLDFGIARLLDDDGEHTRMGMRALTPRYAAPEQAGDGAISTATDVYALGVVLRTLCEDTCPLPADLRNIIARASHPDPDRRYADARALGEDLDNLLQQRPVRATPDSLGYRLRVLLRRRRGAAAAAAMVLLSLVLGAGLALWQAQRAAREALEARHQAARAEAARDFLFSLVRSADSEASDTPDLPVSSLIERGAAALRDQPPDDPELHAEMAMMLGQLDTALGRYDSAVDLLAIASRAADRSADPALRIGVLSRRGTLANAQGDPEGALAHFDAALTLLPAAPVGRRASLIAGIASGWAYAMENSGREAEAHARLQAALNAPYLRPTTMERARVLSALAMTTAAPERQLAILLEIGDLHAQLPVPPTDRLALAANLGTAYARLQRDDAALAWSREAARLADQVHPGSTSRRARAYANLASSANRAGQWPEAASALATAERIYQQLSDDQSPAFAALLNTQGVHRIDTGSVRGAIAPLQRSLDLAQGHFGRDDLRTLGVQRSLAVALLESGDTERAQSLWQDLASRLQGDRGRSRYYTLIVGAEIAARQGDAALIEARLAAAGVAEAVGAGGADPTSGERRAGERMRELRLLAVAYSLRGRADRAEDAFGRARAIGLATGAAAAAMQWRNHLAWAGHLARHGQTAEARAQLDAARALLSASGLDPLPTLAVPDAGQS